MSERSETTLASLFARLEEQPFAVTIAESVWMFPAIESVHVIALALVVGSIGMMDLRLIGVSGSRRSVRGLAAEVLPWTWWAFVMAVLSGLLMFASKATSYWDNSFFRIKLVLLAAAGVNMVLFHALTYRSVDQWDIGVRSPPGARLAGILSLTFWVGVVICGRWVGFT